MQLSFRLDKRPGESHLALDGKKSDDVDALIQHLDEDPYEVEIDVSACLKDLLLSNTSHEQSFRKRIFKGFGWTWSL